MKQPLDETHIVHKLLTYVGCKDIPTVLAKVYFWDFFNSVGHVLGNYGRLSEKQFDAIVNSVLKHTGVTCETYEHITHQSNYHTASKKASNSTKVTVIHNFKDLTTISLFELPFTSGEEVSLTIYPYNSHSMVINLHNDFYKVPKPPHWKIHEEVTLDCTYKRTALKGFLKPIT